MTYNKGKGKGTAWIMANVGYAGDDCLLWPFSRNNYGYGQMGHEGKQIKAHRLMCELAHGPAPIDRPQAAHSCGNGHLGCCNPKHLSWKDNSANQHDRRAHGSPEGAIGRKTRLTQDQIRRIWDSPGRETQLALAAEFGVKRGTIEYWLRNNRSVTQQFESEGK